MALRFVCAGVDLGKTAIRLGQVTGLISEAELGVAGICGIPIDDPDGTLTIRGWATFTVDESDCPVGQQRLFTGFLVDRKYRRGTNDSLVTGAARVIDASLVDINTITSFRLFPQSDSTANRPSETDVARLTWLLGTSYLVPTVHDNGLVNSSGPVTLDAADYRGQSASSLLTDCANASGKNYFVYWDETASNVGLFYDFDYGTAFTCTLSLSNVLSDINGTTCFSYHSDDLDRDPSRVYSGVQVPYSGTGSPVYRTRAATVTKFGVSRDTTAPNVNIKTAGAANAIGDRYLNSIDTENDTVTCTVQLPSSKVGLMRAGMRILFRSSYMPDLDAFTYLRILRTEVKQDEETDQLYNVVLELAPPAPSVSLACSYVAPIGPSTNSSLDVFGARMAPSRGYVVASMLYPSTATIEIGASTGGTQPLLLYGTANNGSGWGIHTGVGGAGPTNQVRWVWDLNSLGSPAICTVRVLGRSSYTTLSVVGSPDLVTWTTVVNGTTLQAANGSPISLSPFVTYRYWAILYQEATPGGGSYYPGLDMDALQLWSAS